MVLLSYLNPFSKEGQEIVRANSNLDTIFDKNDDLINIASHTHLQNQDEGLIPKSIADLAIKRIKWYIERKNNKDFDINDYGYFFNEDIGKYDLIAFHLLSQALSFKFNTKSREIKLFTESQGFIIEDRLSKMMIYQRSELIEDLLKELMVQGNIQWSDLSEIIASKKISLTDLILDNGEIILEREDFINKFGDNFTDRDPNSMYDILIGNNIKELMITKMIMQSCENYILKIKDMSKIIEVHPNLKKLGDSLEEIISEEMSKYSTFYAATTGGAGGFMEIGKLVREAFPPCITNTVKGVSSGGRNDAIVLLLTSFASYARLYPGIFSGEDGVKVSDIDKNLSITENEILPLIFEAADNCNPPLFEDQPQEKVNIISKLGFGMHSDVSLENEGETKWYTPMSCEKIKIHLPNLCKADKGCKGITNPLSYYTRAKWNMKKLGIVDNKSDQ